MKNLIGESKILLKALCEYIAKVKPTEVSNDAFIMLGEIFAEQKLGEVI